MMVATMMTAAPQSELATRAHHDDAQKPFLGLITHQYATRAPYWIKGLNFACHKTGVL